MSESHHHGTLDTHTSIDHVQIPTLADRDLSITQPAPLKQPSSISQIGALRTTRTASHVHFNIEDSHDATEYDANTSRDSEQWFDEDEDDFPSNESRNPQSAPLLTDIEAPSVIAATQFEFEEVQRPKSGIASAFMNMANSIIGAGIISRTFMRG